MNKLNRLKFETYPTQDYFKENSTAIGNFRSLLKFEEALGYDHKSGGFIVLHKHHSPSGIEDELPVCQVLKSQGFCVELVAEYLDKINNGYLDYIKSQTELNVLIIDVSDKDFVKNQEDYIYILDEIQKKIR